MPAPGLDVAAIRHFCEQRVPPHAIDEIRIEADVHRLGVDIMECRPPWRADYGPTWTRRQIARFRWVQKHQHWTLLWSDGDGQWRTYDLAGPTRDILQLLDELDRDPGCFFWG